MSEMSQISERIDKIMQEIFRKEFKVQKVSIRTETIMFKNEVKVCLAGLKTDANTLKNDVKKCLGELKNDLNTLKTDMTTLKKDLKAELENVKVFAANTNTIVSSLKGDVDTFKSVRLDEVTTKTENIKELAASEDGNASLLKQDVDTFKINMGAFKTDADDLRDRIQEAAPGFMILPCHSFNNF